MSSRRRLRPGWYVLVAVVMYAVIAHVMWRGSVAELRQLKSDYASDRAAAAAVEASRGPQAPAGMWFPIPGAGLPVEAANMPGAPRSYRGGVSQGFDFADADAGVPIVYGTAVVAAEAGQVVRADTAYVELDADAWQSLLTRVGESGADAGQLDQLRGRQVWIRTLDGRVLRYGFLAGVRDGLGVGSTVYRGQVIGYVGNSGTGDGVAGTTRNPRLHFEIWQGDTFFGQDLASQDVRARAAALFVGP